jgi:hypothetical protein
MAKLDKVRVTNSGYLKICNECGECKSTLADLPTKNVDVGTTYFVKEEELYYSWDGIEWTPTGGEYNLGGSGGGTGDPVSLDASEIAFDNRTTSIEETTVQGAIKNLDEKVGDWDTTDGFTAWDYSIDPDPTTGLPAVYGSEEYPVSISGLRGLISRSVNSFGTGLNRAFSEISYLKNKNNWRKIHGATLSNTTFPISIPTDCTEVYVQLLNGNTSHAGDFFLLRQQCFHQAQQHTSGGYYSATDCGSFRVQTNTTGITGAGCTKGGQIVGNTNVWIIIHVK